MTKELKLELVGGACLYEGVVSEPRAGESGCGPEEPGVRDLLYCLSDGEYEGRVGERDHDVGIKLLWGTQRERERESGVIDVLC